MKDKFVYFFGAGRAEGSGADRDLLGGKGAGLAEMTSIGLPVPAGFTLSVETCAYHRQSGGKWPRGLDKQIRDQLKNKSRAQPPRRAVAN